MDWMIDPRHIQRARELTARLSLEEKIAQMTQVDGRIDPELWIRERGVGSVLHVTGDQIDYCRTLARQREPSIPLIFGIDAIHGHAFHDGATVYPVQLAQGATFNEGLIQRIGESCAKEVLATGLDWDFAPVLCLGRDPRWGRLSETFGEDPYLAGLLGARFIEGAQRETEGRQMVACAKHFIAYGESRGGRDSSDAPLSKRAIIERFLPPFEKAIAAGCLSVMIGYQSIDGVPCTASSWLIGDLLIDTLGFQGIIITDWDNTGRLYREQGYASSMREAVRTVLTSGCSMVMATPEFYSLAIGLCEQEPMLIEHVDKAVVRNLSVKLACGLFDEEAGRKKGRIIKDRELAFETAVQSLVLLKNEQSTLPLDPSQRIFLMGPQTDTIYNQLGEWSFGPQDFTHKERRPYHQDTLTLARAAREYPGDICVDTSWKEITDGINPNAVVDEDTENLVDALVEKARDYDVLIAAVGDSFEMNGECLDRSDLSLTPSQKLLVRRLRETYPAKPLVAIIIGGKPVVDREFYQLCDAVLEAWNPGFMGGRAILDVLFGQREPEGRLPISIPRTIGQIPVCYDQLPGWHTDRYLDLDPGTLYPFGYGLSYSCCRVTTARIGKQAQSLKQLRAEGLQIETTCHNPSTSRDGSITLQIYLHDLAASVIQPVKRLVRFRKIRLSPQETQTISFSLREQDLSFIAEDHSRIIEPGRFELFIGTSSRDEDCVRLEYQLEP